MHALLIQPAEADARLLNGLLRELGYTVAEAVDGEQALEELNRTTQRFDAILVSSYLGDEDVGGLLHALHEAAPATLVVVTEAAGDLMPSYGGLILLRPFGLNHLRRLLTGEAAIDAVMEWWGQAMQQKG